MKRREMEALSVGECRRFLAAARETEWFALYALALTTGMRPSEYLALKWSDIDWQRGAASVCRTIQHSKAGVSVKVISNQLGHASISFTLERYSPVLPSIQDEAASRVERMLLGSLSDVSNLSSACRLSARHPDRLRFCNKESCVPPSAIVATFPDVLRRNLGGKRIQKAFRDEASSGRLLL